MVIFNEKVIVVYGKQFPFCKPEIRFAVDNSELKLSLFDFNKLEFRDIMREDYHPSLNFAEIAQRSMVFMKKNLVSSSGKSGARWGFMRAVDKFLSKLDRSTLSIDIALWFGFI